MTVTVTPYSCVIRARCNDVVVERTPFYVSDGATMATHSRLTVRNSAGLQEEKKRATKLNFAELKEFKHQKHSFHANSPIRY